VDWKPFNERENQIPSKQYNTTEDAGPQISGTLIFLAHFEHQPESSLKARSVGHRREAGKIQRNGA
jgi:hypothetical protein